MNEQLINESATRSWRVYLDIYIKLTTFIITKDVLPYRCHLTAFCHVRPAYVNEHCTDTWWSRVNGDCGWDSSGRSTHMVGGYREHTSHLEHSHGDTHGQWLQGTYKSLRTQPGWHTLTHLMRISHIHSVRDSKPRLNNILSVIMALIHVVRVNCRMQSFHQENIYQRSWGEDLNVMFLSSSYRKWHV